MHVFLVANHVIERLDLPERMSGPVQKPICFACRKALPTLENLAQSPSRPWMHNCVNVIRHYHPGLQIETRSLVKSKRARHQVCNFSLPEPAIAVTRVEIFVHSRCIPSKQFFLFVPREGTLCCERVPSDRLSFAFELEKPLLRQSPGQSKRDEVSRALAFQMRQSPARMKPAQQTVLSRIGIINLHAVFIPEPIGIRKLPNTFGQKCSAAFPGCGFCGLSSPQSETGDWKVAPTSRLESLLYVFAFANLSRRHRDSRRVMP